MKNNYIYEYHRQISDGTITAPKWIILIYTIIVKGLENKLFFYDEKKAKQAIIFIQNYCHHHEGALAPQTLKLELWQKAIVSCIFAIVDSNGLRHFREVILIVARKNGKTLFAAAIAAYCAFLDGEYGGRIYFAAPKLDQAALCFNAFYQIILQEPQLNCISKKRRTDIYIAETNTSAKSLAFNAKKSDGLNVSLCIADEIASWRGDAGLKFYEVIKSSFGARLQPLLISISTAGYENDGIYDELIKRATRFLLGDSKETRLLPFLYIIDDIEKWNDIEELKKSNPNLGVSVTEEYLLEEIRIAEGSFSKKAEFITKYCNIKQNSSQAWLASELVKNAMGAHLDFNDFKECYAVNGIDLSRTTDLTATVSVIEKSDILNVFAQFYMPAEKIQEATERDGIPYAKYVADGTLKLSGENYVDYHDAERWQTELVKDYKIYPLKTGYDRYSAQYLVQDLREMGFHMDDVYQGENLYPVLLEFEGLLRDGKINIGDNELLAIHLLNCAIKMSVEKSRGKLVKISPSAHIDGAAALIDALTVRQKYHSEIGAQLKNKENEE